MRDPQFYRLHGYLDFMWLKHKNKLPPYPANKLNYPNVEVTGLDLQISRSSHNKATPNLLLTFWQKSDVDLGKWHFFNSLFLGR